jgi:hypothetical protein
MPVLFVFACNEIKFFEQASRKAVVVIDATGLNMSMIGIKPQTNCPSKCLVVPAYSVGRDWCSDGEGLSFRFGLVEAEF